MTWEETIRFIRNKPEFAELVEKAYFDEDLKLNVKRFRNSEEYAETKRILKRYAPGFRTILDVGSGNGISAISFSLDNYYVTALEPDSSETVGAGAIRWLKTHFNLPNLTVYESYAEDAKNMNTLFDVIYVRQAMHHAKNLDVFIKNLAGMLKKGGLLLTVRDHVILNADEKKKFLEIHPLHCYYGGENAFTKEEYTNAILHAGLTVVKVLTHFESVINYFPLSTKELEEIYNRGNESIRKSLKKKLGIFVGLPLLLFLYKKYLGFNRASIFKQMDYPGRMYSFIALKN